MGLSDYQALVPGANRQKPRFAAVLSALLQPLVDVQTALAGMPRAYDLDAADGVQLDAVGQWIGQAREIATPLEVYLTLDTIGLGLDQGVLFGRFSPATGVTTLPDSTYRTLLRAKIAANHWDGSVPSAYALLEQVFPWHEIAIQDHGNMSMTVALIGDRPDAPTLALFLGGYLSVKPAGVTLNLLYSPGPVFGLDVDNSRIGGLNHGYLA